MENSGLTFSFITDIDCKTIECKISSYEDKIKQWDYLFNNYREEITEDDIRLRLYWSETIEKLRKMIKK